MWTIYCCAQCRKLGTWSQLLCLEYEITTVVFTIESAGWWSKTIVKCTLPHFAWNWELDNGKFKSVQKWSLSFCAKVQQFVLFRWTSGQKLKVRIRNFPGTGIANSLLYAPPWPGLKETSSGLCINLRFITPPFTPPFGCNFWMTYKRHTIFQE